MNDNNSNHVLAVATVLAAIIAAYGGLVATGKASLPWQQNQAKETPTPYTTPVDSPKITPPPPTTPSRTDVVNLSAVSNLTREVIALHILNRDSSWEQYTLKPRVTYHMARQNLPVTIRWTDHGIEQRVTLVSKSFTLSGAPNSGQGPAKISYGGGGAGKGLRVR